MRASQCCWFLQRRRLLKGLSCLLLLVQTPVVQGDVDRHIGALASQQTGQCQRSLAQSPSESQTAATTKGHKCESYSACPEKPELWVAWDGTTEWHDTQNFNSADYYRSFADSKEEAAPTKRTTPESDDKNLVAKIVSDQSLLVDYLLKHTIHKSAVKNFIGTMGFESRSEFWERKHKFLTQYQGYNLQVPQTYSREMRRLHQVVYLDWAGSGLYQESQLNSVFNDLSTHAYANAHSRSPAAVFTDNTIIATRRKILHFLRAPPDQYACIFTAGATHAIKLVGETFPWTKESKFLYLRVNHTSVLGVRQYAMAAGAKFRALSYEDVESILRSRKNAGMTNNGKALCLFAFPGKDNFVGHEYPLDWINKIKKYGLDSDCRIQILVDAAALAATKPIDISTHSADYWAISFYKLIGYPTGLGALIAKKDETMFLQKNYFGGGSIVAASCESEWCQMKQSIPSRLEDGTLSFLSIASLQYGLDKLEAFGMHRIAEHVASLTDYLVAALANLTYPNGLAVVHIYGIQKPLRGGIITFNVRESSGHYYSFGQVELDAAAQGIQLRGGCFCNPGGCQDYLKLTDSDMRKVNVERRSCNDISKNSVSKPIGAVRISLGYLTRFEDVDALYAFVRNTYVEG